jgi:hypothetical protein
MMVWKYVSSPRKNIENKRKTRMTIKTPISTNPKTNMA